MLRFAEEIILLLLNDDDGRFARVPSWSLNYALAGGVLMDLALENRIDTDLEKLVLVDATPVGDNLLDETLADIESEEALSRLVSLGILESRADRFLWVFQSRRYPAIDGTAEREVKLRIMEVLFSDQIPSPRDVVIICLADACGIFRSLLSRQELSNASARIEQVRKLDLIGQAMAQAIQDIELSIAASVQGRMY